MKYEILEHTADIGIRACGRTLPELYSTAAEGMFAIIYDAWDGKGSESIALEIDGMDAEHLMVRWLSELLNLSREGWAFDRFEISDVTERKIMARCHGAKHKQPFKPKAEIKLVTYHGLKVERFEEGYRAEVIFDV
ncbi:MAG: archease [Candidatus Edwardsbacteria bacterium]|nr:archease [Candidatus Edwardsbacteria bacterium]MBU1576078.1 archease [Candidatus Edwardsbacteria bacterium]MBU2463680.1 archease [Candidatus Edwardsbacteria bacterium]MBU2594148.1 archease [Candidatus Edwardsbacteria bacterium]